MCKGGDKTKDKRSSGVFYLKLTVVIVFAMIVTMYLFSLCVPTFVGDKTNEINDSITEIRRDVIALQFTNDSIDRTQLDAISQRTDAVAKVVLEQGEQIGEYAKYLDNHITLWLSIIAAICTVLPVVLTIQHRKSMDDDAERLEKDTLKAVDEAVGKKIEELTETFDNTKKEVLAAKNETNKKSVELEEKIAEYIGKLSERKIDLAEKEREIAEFNTKLQDFEARLNDNENKLSNENDDIEKLTQQKTLLDVQSILAAITSFRNFESKNVVFIERVDLVIELVKSVISKMKDFDSNKLPLDEATRIQLFQSTQQVINTYRYIFKKTEDIQIVNRATMAVKRSLDNGNKDNEETITILLSVFYDIQQLLEAYSKEVKN